MTEVNIGYAWGQLLHAFRTANEHADAEVRARARETVEKWERVIAGMQAGTVEVGSRTPTKAPAWVTLEVVTGGFATGRYVAGGPLLDHERALAVRLGVPATRLALNLHYLTSTDAHELLQSGRYRIEVPEEGALLVVAWLRARGEDARAKELVDTLSPWFAELRFYPVPAEQPLELTETVRVQDVGTTLKSLDVDRRQRRFETMRDAVLVWKPLRERAIALFAETIDGERPRLDGNRIAGGWPAARFPEGWRQRVEQLVADRERAGEATTARAREAAQLVDQLARCASAPASLTKAELHVIRRTIARHYAAHGTPEDASRRADEVRAVSGALHADLRRVLVERLRACAPYGGVDAAYALAPVTAEEASRFGVPSGCSLPAYFAPKVARSCEAPIAELVDRRVIASAEVLARVLPQLTGQVRAQTFDDDVTRRLYTALYTAFRRRRGLLLLNYQHQVRFHELPWVAAMEALRGTTDEATSRARKAVASASGLALRAFPYTITPNKLVTELSALTGAAELKLPLVEELAADIFMGAFTAKYVEAAQVSARLLADTVYQRYYAIDVDEVLRIPHPGERPSEELAALCERRAGVDRAQSRWSVARNGKILEQAQILTTHNLAVLFDALPLRDQLAPHLRSTAETCFRWILDHLGKRLRAQNGYQVLRGLKNAAYAWRQMIFWLSFAPDVEDFLRWAREQLASTDGELRRRFEPAQRGLELAARGLASDDPAFTEGGGRVFTGWSTDRHWLSPAAA